MKKVITANNRKYEVVDELPLGYQLWNIGRENFKFKKYIPLCQVVNEHSINPNTLKALKVSSETFALELMDISIKKILDYKQLKELLN